MNISGSTIHVDDETLPLKKCHEVLSPFPKENMPRTLKPLPRRFTIMWNVSAGKIPIRFWPGRIDSPAESTYNCIKDLAEGIYRGMSDYLRYRGILIVVMGADCGKALGQCLDIVSDHHIELVCVDQIDVDEGDYIDIGNSIMGGRVVPRCSKNISI